MNRIQITCVPALLLATCAFGCNSSNRPAAPTAADTNTAQVTSTATVGSWTSQNRWRATTDGFTVEATDVITAVTGTCPSVTITVRGVQVAVNGSTVFGSGITCAGLAVDATVKVTALLTTGTGGAFSVVATRIETGSSAPAESGTPTVEEDVAGTVASVTGTCPARTITLTGTGGVVVANGTTTFDPAGACGTIAAGTVIQAHGTRNADGQLVADAIKVYEQATGHGKKVSGEGRVGHLTGTCPTLSMIIVGAHVTTSAATTTFENGVCSAIRNGSNVAVTGETQTDGSVVAVVVRIIGQPGNGNGHK